MNCLALHDNENVVNMTSVRAPCTFIFIRHIIEDAVPVFFIIYFYFYTICAFDKVDHGKKTTPIDISL